MLVRCLCTTSHIVQVTHAPTVVPFVDTNYVAMRLACPQLCTHLVSLTACLCLLAAVSSPRDSHAMGRPCHSWRLGRAATRLLIVSRPPALPVGADVPGPPGTCQRRRSHCALVLSIRCRSMHSPLAAVVLPRPMVGVSRRKSVWTRDGARGLLVCPFSRVCRALSHALFAPLGSSWLFAGATIATCARYCDTVYIHCVHGPPRPLTAYQAHITVPQQHLLGTTLTWRWSGTAACPRGSSVALPLGLALPFR